MCELRLAGRDKEIEKYSKDPKYVCGNCGTQSNEQGALCAPGPLDSE